MTGQLVPEAQALTCRKGSLMPDTSCSGEYPDMMRFFRILTSCGTSWRTARETESSRVSKEAESSTTHNMSLSHTHTPTNTHNHTPYTHHHTHTDMTKKEEGGYKHVKVKDQGEREKTSKCLALVNIFSRLLSHSDRVDGILPFGHLVSKSVLIA